MAQLASQSPGIFRRYRWKELGLFIIPFLVLLLEMTQLLIVKSTGTASEVNLRKLPIGQGLTPIIGLIVAMVAFNITLSIFFRKADQILLPLVGTLSGLSVLMATRIGPDIGDSSLGNKQLIWVLVGIILCIATVVILRNINFLERYKYTWALLTILLLLPSVFSGIETLHSGSPTHDTLNFGPFAFQPSELMKISLIIFFSAYLNENRDIIASGYIQLGRLRLPPLRQLGPLVFMLGISLLMFLVVRELGLALLIFGLFLAMTYLTSGKITYVIVNLALLVVLGAIGYLILPYIRARFAVVSFNVVDWKNWTATDLAYEESLGGPGQIVQGLISISSGGMLGAGLGLGHPGLVPVVQSDMVLAAFAEEFGMVGIFAVIGIYLLIVYRGFRIAIESRDTFNQLLAAGLTSIFALQTLIISTGVLKLIPFTGMPLPFLSYGGSSMIANFIIIGILLRISYNNAVERDGMA